MSEQLKRVLTEAPLTDEELKSAATSAPEPFTAEQVEEMANWLTDYGPAVLNGEAVVRTADMLTRLATKLRENT